MPNSLPNAVPFRNRNTLADSEAARKEAQDRRYAAAFLGMARSLKCRPEPRSRFDEVAQGEAKPWRHLVEPALACIRAGAPKEDVAEFFAELTSDVMGRYGAIRVGGLAMSVEESALAVFKMSLEAQQWRVAVLLSSDATVLEMAERTARAELEALTQHLAVLSDAIRNRTRSLRSGRAVREETHTPDGE